LGHTRFLCIHGHFYQPPRENPWIDEIEVQDSATPFHDWNARITAECYGPNAAARILAGDRRIMEVVSNYRSISFNFGPTLLSWMQRAEPGIYQQILDADRESRAERGGHGNAIAQAYNHMILPLANKRDKITQVRWGLTDFLLRFGRRSEGMWLPETAADTDTLEVLAAQGVKFTILSPYQARCVRPNGHEAWQRVEGGHVDPTRPYLVRLPSGKTITVFFYDGPIAKAFAFEGGLASPEELLRRLEGGYHTGREHEELLNVAVDGETFGHHKKGGDEVLAAALAQAESRGMVLTNYGQYLEHHPAEWEAQLVEPSSWSCAHGVERWTSDCGCNAAGQPGWKQAWRAPLRHALDALRNQLAELYEREAGQLFSDPWAARDAYIEVMLDNNAERVEAWLAEREAQPGALASEHAKVQALRLLEMQRHAMLMYTSCGWFFSEVSGLESVQVLKYAARAIQLAREAGGPSLEAQFLEDLRKAPSNLPELRDGATVYERYVRPSVATLPGIVAHHAIARLFDPTPQHKGRVFRYRFQQLAWRRESVGPATLSVGRVRLISELTHEKLDATFAVLHFGGNDFRCSVRPFTDVQTYEELERELFHKFSRFSLSDVVRLMDAQFVGQDFSLRDLFVDERRALARKLLRETLSKYEGDYERIFEENRRLMRFLLEINTPIPPALRAAAELTLSMELRTVLDELRDNALSIGAAKAQLGGIMAEARILGARLDVDGPRLVIEQLILEHMRRLGASPRREIAREMVELIDLGDTLGVGLNLWEVQNLFWDLVVGGAPEFDRDIAMRLGERLCFDRRSLEARLRGLRGSTLVEMRAVASF
jgi:alpha-amylase/alpha-mannosidase (GH57 family)